MKTAGETVQPSFYGFNEVQQILHQENFPVVVASHKHKYPSEPLHSHDFTEIVIVNSGQGRHIIDDREQPLAVGDIFIIPRGIKHGYINDGNLVITNMLFQMSTIDEHFPEIKAMPGFFSFFMAGSAANKVKPPVGRLLNLDDEELAHVESLQNKIKIEQHGVLSGKASMCLLYLAEILIYLSRLLENRQEEHSFPDTYGTFAKVYDYMNRNYRDKISIEKLAAIARMSERNFQRIFTRIYRISPAQYLMKIRLEKSRDLLKSTSWEISKVALESGFQENSYFSLQFKKAFNLSPRQFRKIVKNRPQDNA